MNLVKENLNTYNDYKFFSLLEEVEKNKDPKKQLDAKTQVQASKDAQDIIKKIKENFGRFKSYAGNQVAEYKNFWNMQTVSRKAVTGKDNTCKVVYALFNDSSSDKYKPEYLVCLKKLDGNFSLYVIKTHLEGEEKNPIFNVSNKEASNEFINFMGEIKDEMKEIKNHYIKTIETKKKEEEHKEKREKLDKFLKENKKDK